jgi:hypothetical protein
VESGWEWWSRVSSFKVLCLEKLELSKGGVENLQLADARVLTEVHLEPVPK